VAPQVLETGEIEGKSFVIQEFIEGPNPEKNWFAGHLAYLAAFTRKYHEDTPLIELLSHNQALTHRELVARDIAELEERWENLQQAGKLEGGDLEAAFDKLRKDGAALEAVELAPVHAEPNNRNMLLDGERLVMVDWDEIRLGDPVQDTGQMLWWYVPPARWAEFFKSYGLNPDQELLDRLFWWTARASLVIACWRYEHGFDGQEFLRDFRASVNQQANPHATC
jgi:thiamine kinase-like enzyme